MGDEPDFRAQGFGLGLKLHEPGKNIASADHFSVVWWGIRE